MMASPFHFTQTSRSISRSLLAFKTQADSVAKADRFSHFPSTPSDSCSIRSFPFPEHTSMANENYTGMPSFHDEMGLAANNGDNYTANTFGSAYPPMPPFFNAYTASEPQTNSGCQYPSPSPSVTANRLPYSVPYSAYGSASPRHAHPSLAPPDRSYAYPSASAPPSPEGLASEEPPMTDSEIETQDLPPDQYLVTQPSTDHETEVTTMDDFDNLLIE